MASSVIGALRINLGIDSAQFQDGLKKAQSGMKKFGATMKQGAMAAGAAFFTAGAGISVAIKGVIDSADDMTKAAQKIGIPVDELQRLKHAAELSGVSFEGLQTAVGRLSRVMNDAKNGTAEAIDTFAQLGISATNADGSLKSASAVLAEVSEKFATMPDGAEKTALAMELMGRAGATMIPLLNGGSDALQKMKDEADALGIVFTPEMGKNAEQFNDNLDRLSKVFGGIMTQIASAAAGPLAEFTDWLVEIGKAFSQMSPWLKDAVTRFGLFSAAVAVVVAPLGIVVAGIIAIGAPVAAAAAGIIAITAAVVAFWPEIQTLAGVVANFVSGAWASFEAAWDGMVAKVHSVKDSIIEFAASIPGVFMNLASQMVEIGAQIIQGLWDGLKSKMSAVKDSLTGFASGLVDSVKSTLGIHSPSKVMHEVGTNIMQGLSDGMTSMESGIGDIAQSIGSTISSAFRGVIDGTKSVKEAIGDVLKSLASMLMDSGFKALTQGLFGNLGGGGGFLGSLFSGLFGFANGGSFQVGGAGGIDSQLVAFKASPNERVTVTKPGQERHGGTVAVQVGVSVDDDGKIKAYVTDMGHQAAKAGAQLGVRQVSQSLPSMMANAQARSM